MKLCGYCITMTVVARIPWKNILTAAIAMGLVAAWDCILIGPGAHTALELLISGCTIKARDSAGVLPWSGGVKAAALCAAVDKLGQLMTVWLRRPVKPEDAQESLCHHHKFCSGNIEMQDADSWP